MIDLLTQVLLWIGAISAGLMAGVYFAFSGFIMQSFDRLGAAQATAAMNSINEVILRSWFLPLFFGSSLVFLILAILTLLDWSGFAALLQLAAGIIYVVGMFLCTVVFNVPLNNRLASASTNSTETAELWTHYLRHWTRWNHARTISSAMACGLCIWLLAR